MKTKMPTLSEATKVVYRRRKNGTKSAANFLIGMKHNIKALGDLPVNKITRPLVNKMMDYHKEKLKNSNAVINQKMGYLRVVLSEMEEDGFIEMIKMPKPRPTKNSKVHYLTEDMEKELLDYLYSRQNPNTYMAAEIVKCLIDLGCRVNELMNLEFRFVDFENNQAVAVPMTDRVQKIMKKCFSYGARPTEKVFCGVNYAWLNNIWQKARKDLGYADKKFYTIHLCRHTCGSRLAQRGVPILLIKDWLGHEDIENTMIYAHLAPKALHSVVNVLND